MATLSTRDANNRPIRPVLTEIAPPAATDLYRHWLGDLKTNPDPILREKAGAKGIAFYEHMLRTDSKLFSLVQTRANALLGRPREIVAASDGDMDGWIRDFVQDVIGGMENFEQDLRELCDAIPKGFAVSEIMWKLDGKGRVVVDRLLSRDQKSFGFHRDTNELLLRTADCPAGRPVPPRKFLVHSFNPKHENPYGSAVLSYCYWAYFFKKHSVKWWSIFNEKFGQPTVIAKYQRGLPAEDQATLRDIIERIKVETGVTLPDDIAIDLLEAHAGGGAQTHKEFIDLMDRWEAQAVLGGTLTSDAGERGARSLGEVHEGVRAEYVRGDAESLMGVVNHQLIRWLVDWNYARPGRTRRYPRLVIDTSPPDDLRQRAEVYRIVVREMGLPVAKRHLYDAFNIPAPAEGEELLRNGE
ncbi:MAG: DUF935 family protein [Planctomycetota bacterium]